MPTSRRTLIGTSDVLRKNICEGPRKKKKKNRRRSGRVKYTARIKGCSRKRKFRNSVADRNNQRSDGTNIKMDVLRANTTRAQQPPEKLAPSRRPCPGRQKLQQNIRHLWCCCPNSGTRCSWMREVGTESSRSNHAPIVHERRRHTLGCIPP